MAIKPKAGMRFGEIRVVRFSRFVDKPDRFRWIVRCKCGDKREVGTQQVRKGSLCVPCGTQLRVAHMRTHGMGESPEYNSWHGMLARCHRKTDKQYFRYGARGIKVCKRWRKSFVRFYKDMGPKPGPKYSIDRKNNDGNYKPSNCRWATAQQQAENRRTNAPLTIGGVTKFVREWAEITGLKAETIKNRVHLKWPDHRLLAKARLRFPDGKNLKRLPRHERLAVLAQRASA